MTDEYLVERAKRLYEIIVNRELGDDENCMCNRVCIVGELESITGKKFRNTAEFHREVGAFLARKNRDTESIGTRIRRARKKSGLTMRGLAKELGVSEKMIQRWELNADGYVPNPAVMEWLNKTLSNGPESTTSENGPHGETGLKNDPPIVLD